MGSVWVGENEYYSYEDLDKTNANYRVVIGERSNGKTYGFKQKALLNFLNFGKEFAYVRRHVEEIQPKRTNRYWDDIWEWAAPLLREKYGYKFYTIIAKKNMFTLYGYEDDIKKKEEIGVLGHYFALNQGVYDKSTSYPNVNLICYEEFLTDQRELPDEFTLFLNLISTIKRKREDVTIYLLGNTVSRNSVILESMNINVRDLIQGDIKVYTYYTEGGATNTVAIEYCRNYAQSDKSEAYFSFGHQQENMITKGAWQTRAYPLFKLDDFYTKRPTFGIILQTSKIKLYIYIVENKNNLTAYVSDKRLATRIDYYTLNNQPTNLHFNTFNINSPIDGAMRLKRLMFGIYMNDNVLYESNVIGSDFERIISILINKSH